MLDDTLLNNIVFIDDDIKIDKTKLDNAIHYSGLENVIKELKNGINTEVGERGTFLSGGQIQRIALARILYKDPEVLILDEFTNSLDPENENFILDQLELLKTKKNKTFIIISHKIRPLKICDEIVLIDKGKVAEVFNYNDFYNRYNLLYN